MMQVIFLCITAVLTFLIYPEGNATICWKNTKEFIKYAVDVIHLYFKKLKIENFIQNKISLIQIRINNRVNLQQERTLK